jgi:predicted RNA-binding protein with PIN domain
VGPSSVAPLPDEPERSAPRAVRTLEADLATPGPITDEGPATSNGMPGDVPAGSETGRADAAAGIAAAGIDAAGIDAAGGIGGAGADSGGELDWSGLPGPVRGRLAELAAAALGGMEAVDVPPGLRHVARFAPAKRAKLGGSALVGALARSGPFRLAVVGWARENRPDALNPDCPEPAAATAAAALIDPGKVGRLAPEVSAAVEAGRLRAERDAAVTAGQRLGEELERLKATLAKVTGSVEGVRGEQEAELDRLRARLREQGVKVRRAVDAANAARDELTEATTRAAAELAAAHAERDRERERADNERRRAVRAEQDAEVARQAAREARQADEVRLQLLVDTLAGAVTGLRRELALGDRFADPGMRADTGWQAGPGPGAGHSRRRDGSRRRGERTRRGTPGHHGGAASPGPEAAAHGPAASPDPQTGGTGGTGDGWDDWDGQGRSGPRGPRPADLVRGASRPGPAAGRVESPAALDRLLALPTVHLVVDGYNVTKTGYPELTLSQQRDRLAQQMSALVARTGAEVTVVFDGAGVVAVPSTSPRGVRVLFSDPGVLADDVIRALVAAEPEGRPVVVVTSDRAVADSVRRRGAHPVPSAVLIARLNRI